MCLIAFFTKESLISNLIIMEKFNSSKLASSTKEKYRKVELKVGVN